MATLIDDGNHEARQELAKETNPLESLEIADTALDAAPQETQESEEDTPDQYKGKSLKDLIAMHQDTQRFVGQQANQIGELRKAVDSVLQSDLAKKETPEETPVDFFDNPDEAVNRAIAQHPSVRAAEEMGKTMARQASQARLQAKHPDIASVIQDPGFAEWIGKSDIRKKLFEEGQNYNFDAADELISNYKERLGVVSQTVAVEETARSNQLKGANTGNSRGTGATSKKILRRVDIINLMKSDPDRYEALLPEISAAYAENRVK